MQDNLDRRGEAAVGVRILRTRQRAARVRWMQREPRILVPSISHAGTVNVEDVVVFCVWGFDVARGADETRDFSR